MIRILSKNYNLQIPLFIFLSYLLPFLCILLMENTVFGQISTMNFLLFGIEAASPTIAAITIVLVFEKKEGIKKFFRLNFSPNLKISSAFFSIIIAFTIMFTAKFISCLLLGTSLEIMGLTSKQLIIIAWAFVAEEIGWRGFLAKKLTLSFHQVIAPLLVGLIWAFWHYHFFIIGSINVPIHLFIAGCVVDSYLYFALIKISSGNILIAMLYHLASNFFLNLFLINPDDNCGSSIPYATYVMVSGIFVIGISVLYRYRKYRN